MWTEERVELLKKLWSDGLSASQIAGRLGSVTRNAVIGKVHRLGLSGRATTSRIRPMRPRNRLTPGQPPGLNRMHFRAHGNTALKTILAPFEHADVALAVLPAVVVRELEIPPAQRVNLLELKECSCRWPIGDPQSEEFYFCGRQKKGELPYCEHHAAVAYQPLQRRRQQQLIRF